MFGSCFFQLLFCSERVHDISSSLLPRHKCLKCITHYIKDDFLHSHVSPGDLEMCRKKQKEMFIHNLEENFFVPTGNLFIKLGKAQCKLISRPN